jgi:hypothetical protein
MSDYTFYLVLQIYEDSSTLFQFAEQAEALKRYLKYPGPSILYELTVGEKPALREVLRKEPESEAEHA